MSKLGRTHHRQVNSSYMGQTIWRIQYECNCCYIRHPFCRKAQALTAVGENGMHAPYLTAPFNIHKGGKANAAITGIPSYSLDCANSLVAMSTHILHVFGHKQSELLLA